MDFSNVTSIAIPQGNVTKITDASGRVLWQKNTASNGFFTFETTDGSIELSAIALGGDDSRYMDLAALKEAYDAGHGYVYYVGPSAVRDLYVSITNLTADQALELRKDDFTCYFEGITYTCTTLVVNGTMQQEGLTISLAKGTGSVQIELTFPDVFDQAGDDAIENTEDLDPKIYYKGNVFFSFGDYDFIKYSYSPTNDDWQVR